MKNSVLISDIPEDFNLKDLDFVNWLIKHQYILNPEHKPRFRHIIYIEQIISGIGVQTDYELFEMYIKAWKDTGKLRAVYNKDLDCIEYYIENILSFRKYDFGCIV